MGADVGIDVGMPLKVFRDASCGCDCGRFGMLSRSISGKSSRKASFVGALLGPTERDCGRDPIGELSNDMGEFVIAPLPICDHPPSIL